MVSAIQGTSQMGQMRGVGMMPKMTELTDSQKSTITDILSQYDPSNVSDEDAKAIFQAFKDADITPAKGMKEVIEAAGFDADDLRSRGLPDQGMPPPQTSSANSINLSALQSLQELLSEYDLTNLSETDQNSLTSALETSGFIFPGSVIDVKS